MESVALTPLGLDEDGCRMERKRGWGSNRYRSETGWGGWPKRTRGESSNMMENKRQDLPPSALLNEEETAVVPMEMEEASVSEGDGSPVYEVPEELDVSVWSEQEVKAFVNGVLSAMRTIAEQVPLMVTTPLASWVWKDLFALFLSREPDDWVTAEASTHGRYVRAFLLPQGLLLASLLELGVFAAYLRGVLPALPVTTSLTLSEEEEGREPGMQDKEEEVPGHPVARQGLGSTGAVARGDSVC